MTYNAGAYVGICKSINHFLVVIASFKTSGAFKYLVAKFFQDDNKMSALTDFERELIVGGQLVGASMITVARVVEASRAAVSSIMTGYSVPGKTSSVKHKSSQKMILTDRDRRVLKRIVTYNKTTVLKIGLLKSGSDLNLYLQSPVSIKKA